MSIFAPIMNPLRFYKSTDTVDYSTKFSNIFNMRQRTEYQQSARASQYFKEFLVNNEIALQFRTEFLSDNRITITTPTGSTVLLNPTNISPSGWTGTPVYKFTYTPTTEGIYSMAFNNGDYVSDKFVALSTEKYRKKLVNIEYYNSVNDYGMIFYDGGTLNFTGKTYFTGTWRPGVFQDISSFESDRGDITKLRATPNTVIDLTLCDIHWTYIDNINYIFSCDNLTVNNINCQNNEGIKIDPIENSDLVNISVQLTMKNNSFFVKEIS